MGATSRERYAVVSCHVERPLDDAVWTRFAALQEARPGGFAMAALVRPADPAFDEDEARWVDRARGGCEAVARSGITRTGRRPTTLGRRATRTGARVLAEGRRVREPGLAPTLFCGGGWYTDVEVAEACAELGYVDCTPRATRPPYLAAGERWASLGEPARVELPSGRELSAIPTTHSLGDLARALPRRALPGSCTSISTTPISWTADDGRSSRSSCGLSRARRGHGSGRARGSCAADAPRIAWHDVARL
jgi:hypothetical protein